MQDPIVVVGSGASAVHFAQTALELGRRVLMLDVGYPKPAPAQPEASLNQLKAELAKFPGFQRVLVTDVKTDARRGGKTFTVSIKIGESAE